MPDAFDELEARFGGPSDDGFGSAVFRRPAPPGSDLEALARDVYRDFVGELWTRFGAEAWTGAWSELAARSAAAEGSVLDLLGAIADPLGRSAADMLVNGGPDPEAAAKALADAFDREGISGLKVFRIGDGEAMSGVIVAGSDRDAGEAAFVAFLMD